MTEHGDFNREAGARFDVPAQAATPDVPHLQTVGDIGDEVNGQAATEVTSQPVSAWGNGDVVAEEHLRIETEDEAEPPLPAAEEVGETVRGLHARIFDTAGKPMLWPQDAVKISSMTKWTVGVVCLGHVW